MFTTRKLIIPATLICGFMTFASGSNAQVPEIQTVYSTQKGACDQGASHRVVISQGRITGPDFECTITNGTPAGTGLESYSAVCTIAGKQVADTIALDLGNNPDHFSLALPNRDEWLDLYPCTKVPGLE